jgi:GSCFA family
MTSLPQIPSQRGGHEAEFHGTWYRGPHTNFLPSKAELQEPNAVEKFVLPGWLPESPFIDKTTPITAFGSCFAANISEILTQRGYNVFGRNLDLQAHIVRFGEGIVNSFAVRQQFEWALGEREFPENLWFGPNKEIAAVDSHIRAETLDILNSTEVFIITLGLSEIWYDKVTGDAFWRAIPASLFDESRHGFRLSTPAENYENLRAVVTLARKLNPSAKVVFTLSPIPLMATFRPISCLTANSVSKAILRVAIDRLMDDDYSNEKHVFYFPAYEIVTEMFPDSRMDDNRHIRQDVVEFAMRTFCSFYCVPEAAR